MIFAKWLSKYEFHLFPLKCYAHSRRGTKGPLNRGRDCRLAIEEEWLTLMLYEAESRRSYIPVLTDPPGFRGGTALYADNPKYGSA
jgi:hypothetical protein